MKLVIMLLNLIIYSQSCTNGKELCLSPQIQGSTATIEITFQPFQGYLAFGYGGLGMDNQNMVVISNSTGVGYTANSYYSKRETTPQKVTNTWNVISSGSSSLTISGPLLQFPTSAGNFVWASGEMSGGVLMKHSSAHHGSFSVVPFSRPPILSSSVLSSARSPIPTPIGLSQYTPVFRPSPSIKGRQAQTAIDSLIASNKAPEASYASNPAINSLIKGVVRKSRFNRTGTEKLHALKRSNAYLLRFCHSYLLLLLLN